MKISVLREQKDKRVCLIPDTVKKLVAIGNDVFVESGAGVSANFSDAEFISSGAKISSDRAEILSTTEILTAVNLPEKNTLGKLKKDAIVIALMRPLDESINLKPILEQELTAISLEMIPRTTRAQAMDVLSSMATIVGYKSVLFSAEKMPKMFPMMTTAAGTIPPAKVLVIGAGVAGLQAIATARRLGAIVEAFDIRAAAGEAVRSLGAKFIEIDNINAETESGYAKEISETEMQKARDLIEKHAETSDCIISSAQVPGKISPLLITRKAVEKMKKGAIIVDLAGQTGGNCELSKFGEEVEHNGVKIFSPNDFASEISVHSSQLFSRNVFNLLELLLRNGELNLDLEDEILNKSCIVHQGRIRNEDIKKLFEENLKSLRESAG